MLPLPPFAWEAPDNLADLLELAAEPGARLIAGGTDLLPSMKHRLFLPSVLIGLGRVAALAEIRATDGGLTLGAAATLAAVSRHPDVRARYPALAAACRTVATPTIQGMGTLGGNVLLDTRCLYYNQPAGWRAALGGCLKADGEICHVARAGSGCYAAHSADTVPVLWLMGATLTFQSARGERRAPISELYAEDGRDGPRMEPGEVLTAIHLPRPGAPIVHRKVRLRAAIDYPALLVAVQRVDDGARAVLSALGPRPQLVEVAVAADLPELGYAAARPLNTHAVSTSWRKHMVRVELRRALEALAAGAQPHA